MFTEEHLYAIALRECTLIGDINFQKLIEAFGTAKDVWEFAKTDNQNNIDGIGRKILSDIGNKQHLIFAEKELKFCEANNIKIFLRNDENYPNMVKECSDAPAILYLKGNMPKCENSLSIVGTRNMTAYGKQFLEHFFESTKKIKYQTISGLALGVDSEVHNQSIKHKIPTAAVLAHGFHTLYPSANRKLSEKIIEENGALITEFNSSRKPDRENFIQRNRIVAGFSPSTIVVETGFGGGSMSTAHFANIYNRDVYALPGKITDVHSQGCNLLVLQNKAFTISSIKKLIEQLGFTKAKEKIEELFPSAPKVHLNLNDQQKPIYDIIMKQPKISLDEICDELNLASYQILPILLDLELLGIVQSLSGKKYLVK